MDFYQRFCSLGHCLAYRENRNSELSKQRRTTLVRNVVRGTAVTRQEWNQMADVWI